MWGSSRPRIKPQILHLSKVNGGLGLPNFSSYYKAAQLANLVKYHAIHEPPLWVSIEAVECDPVSISNVLWISPKARKHIHNPITKHSLSLWDRLKVKHLLQSPHIPLLSFYRNPAFYPAWIYPNTFRKGDERLYTPVWTIGLFFLQVFSHNLWKLGHSASWNI